jgi:hypothetical protein
MNLDAIKHSGHAAPFAYSALRGNYHLGAKARYGGDNSA